MRAPRYLTIAHAVVLCSSVPLRPPDAVSAPHQWPKLLGNLNTLNLPDTPLVQAVPPPADAEGPGNAAIPPADAGGPGRVAGPHTGVALLSPNDRLDLAPKVDAAASLEAAAANRVDATRLIYTANEEVSSFALAGGANGMQLILWGCIAALISIMAVSGVFLVMHYRYQSSNSHGPHESLADLFPVPSPWHSSNRCALKSEELLGSEHSMSSVCSGSSARTGSDSRNGNGAMLPGLPLCPLLIVPDGTRLACIVQNDVKHKRQELSFDIEAVPARGGMPLFRVRVSELGDNATGIYVETLTGREQLAYISTEAIWQDSANPVLSISRPWGLPYGTVQKTEDGTYHVFRGKTTLLIFSGDFYAHNIEVRNSTRVVAQVQGTSPEEYQVHMAARTDAGLVILALLAIDKCEMHASVGHKSPSSNNSDTAM